MYDSINKNKIYSSYSLKIIAETSVVIDLTAKLVSNINTFEYNSLTPFNIIFKEETCILSKIS